jgi:TonB family protein
MPNLCFKPALYVTIVSSALGLFSQSPSTSPESTTPDSGAKSGNSNASAKAPAYKPSCSYSPNPPYTKEARDARFQGVVRVEVIVMPDGSLTNIRIVKSPGMGLDESFVETLKSWKCAPAIYNGKQVPTKVPIEINFRLKSMQ